MSYSYLENFGDDSYVFYMHVFIHSPLFLLSIGSRLIDDCVVLLLV